MLNVPFEVKKALRDGRQKKNYRFLILNNDGTTDFTINNSTLVKESVSIDERMCSGDVLKFGLCEGSSLEFQYFDHPTITDRRIQAFVDVDYGESNPYPIPMGFFDVEKCSRQASTGIIKATCVNKLKSDYLDTDANEAIIDLVAGGEEGQTDVSFYYILRNLLAGYNIDEYKVKKEEIDITAAQLDSPTYFADWLTYHAATTWELAFPLYNSSQSSTSYYLHIQAFSYNTKEATFPQYYREVFNGNVAQNIKSSVYNLSSNYLDNYYVRNRTSPYSYMTLREYLKSAGYQTFYAYTPNTYVEETEREIVGGSLVSPYESTYLSELTEDYTTSICHGAQIMLPYRAFVNTSSSTTASMTDYTTYFKPLHNTYDWIYKSLVMDVPPIAINTIDEAQAEALPDVTLRELQSAVYETACQFGQLSRVTDLFSGVELNQSRLYPQETLYPANTVYPDGAAVSANKSMYSKLWADEGNVHKWRNLVITYKHINPDTQTAELYTITEQVNADGTEDYICSDNWLFKNLVWSDADMQTYAAAMVAKMQNITWFPFEMWCAGLPYLETGDEIEIPLGENSYTSYVLSRTLKGIQNLQDTYINGTLDIF